MYTKPSSIPACNDESVYPETYVEKALRAAKFNTIGLASRCGLTRAERDDAFQDLLVHALAAADKYDPSRASEATYANLVCKSRAYTLLDSTIKTRQHEKPVSQLARRCAANDSGEEVEEEAGDTLGRLGVYFFDTQRVDSRCDLEMAIRHMSPDQLELFTLIGEGHSVEYICDALDISPATYHRRAHDMRMHLRMFGFKEAA